MAEKRKYNATLNAKGLEQHVTEDLAREMATHQGRTYLLIVAAHSGAKVVGEDGSEKASLVADLVDVIPEEHAERVRAFQRALYLSRPDQMGQRVLQGTTGTTMSVEDAAANLDAIIERDEATGEVTGFWDGDPDAPVEQEPADENVTPCDYPGCTAVGDHDEHEIGTTEAPAEESPANVVSFSSKG